MHYFIEVLETLDIISVHGRKMVFALQLYFSLPFLTYYRYLQKYEKKKIFYALVEYDIIYIFMVNLISIFYGFIV